LPYGINSTHTPKPLGGVKTTQKAKPFKELGKGFIA
jgi:hypothetical protein